MNLGVLCLKKTLKKYIHPIISPSHSFLGLPLFFWVHLRIVRLLEKGFLNAPINPLTHLIKKTHFLKKQNKKKDREKKNPIGELIREAGPNL